MNAEGLSQFIDPNFNSFARSIDSEYCTEAGQLTLDLRAELIEALGPIAANALIESIATDGLHTEVFSQNGEATARRLDIYGRPWGCDTVLDNPN